MWWSFERTKRKRITIGLEFLVMSRHQMTAGCDCLHAFQAPDHIQILVVRDVTWQYIRSTTSWQLFCRSNVNNWKYVNSVWFLSCPFSCLFRLSISAGEHQSLMSKTSHVALPCVTWVCERRCSSKHACLECWTWKFSLCNYLLLGAWWTWLIHLVDT